ncbi:glucose-6-phosphate isomerase [bacterium]|nr:glucose-6-phosphate isomerase [bacterium]
MSSWKQFTKNYFSYPEIGLALDLSRMNYPENLFSALETSCAAAFSEMVALEAGAIANADEQRMVGHYWLRNSDLAPSKEIKLQIDQAIQAVIEFAKIARSQFKRAILVGIGGSALGPQFLIDALSDQLFPIEFLDNTDPDGVDRLTAVRLGLLKETLVIVISKSGSTLETRNGQIELAVRFSRSKLNFADHTVAITCAASKLEHQAKAEKWLKILPLWDWVGGRTSIFSPVGLLPAALSGINLQELLAGARLMDQLTRIKEIKKNPAMLLALMWHAAGSGVGLKDMVVLPYKDRLILFSRYLQQLVMESLGKEKNRAGAIVNQGIAVYGNKGSTDQHAYVQQLRDGINNFFVTFIEVLSDSAQTNPQVEVEPGITSGDYLSGFYLGTRQALTENGRASITITVESVSAQTIGALIALYERAVGFYATLVNVNAYHQPGVEAGKKAAAGVIALQREIQQELNNSGQLYTAEELASKLKADTEITFKILEHLAANQHAGVTKRNAQDPLQAKYSISRKRS